MTKKTGVFPPATLAFLRALERNNNREWFAARRSQYESDVRAPMVGVIQRLQHDLAKIAPEHIADPAVSLFRIYRDTRFSKDKSPLKTQLGAHFPHRELRKRGASLYFEIGPERTWIGAGLVMPSRPELDLIRNAIASHHKEFLALVEDSKFRRTVGQLHGKQVVRVPARFARDHPAGSSLRFKQFFVGQPYPASFALDAKFYDQLLRVFVLAVRFTRFMNGALKR